MITKSIKLRPDEAQQLLLFLRFAQDEQLHLRWAEKLHKNGAMPAECGKAIGLLKEVEAEIVLQGEDFKDG